MASMWATEQAGHYNCSANHGYVGRSIQLQLIQGGKIDLEIFLKVFFLRFSENFRSFKKFYFLASTNFLHKKLIFIGFSLKFLQKNTYRQYIVAMLIIFHVLNISKLFLSRKNLKVSSCNPILEIFFSRNSTVNIILNCRF